MRNHFLRASSAKESTLEYINTYTGNSVSVSLGDPSNNRYIVLATSYLYTARPRSLITSVSIAGVSGSIVGNATGPALTYISIVPIKTGTTGTLTYTFSETFPSPSNLTTSVYRLETTKGSTAVDTKTTEAGTASLLSVNLTCPSKGVAIGVSCSNATSTNTWTNLTVDNSVSSSTHSRSAASETGIPAGSLSISISTALALTTASWA